MLDEVLPEQLRLFNSKLGVVGDHSKRPNRVIVREPISGKEFLLDHQGDATGLEPPELLETSVDENGVEHRRYHFLGEGAEKALFDQLRKEGKKLEIYERTLTPFLIAGELQKEGMGMGGAKGLRAAARIALNFMAVHFPDHARSRGLEAFKDWVLDANAGVDSRFAHFGAPLADGGLPAPSVDFAHRVVLAFDGRRALARIVFFDAYEIAVDMGEVDEDAHATLRGFDVDPLSKARKRRPDVHVLPIDLLKVAPAEVGRMVSTKEHGDAVHERAADRLNAIVQEAHEAEWERRLTVISAALSRTVELDPERRHAAVVKLLLKHCPQHATNLVLEVFEWLATFLESKGAHPYHAAAFRELIRPDKKTGSIRPPVDGFVQHLLDEMRAVLVESPSLGKAELRSLLDGDAGLRLATNVVRPAVFLMPGLPEFLAGRGSS